MEELKNICIKYLKGLCEDKKCFGFHPIKLKDNFSHWSLGYVNDPNLRFSIKANSIGFDKTKMKKIRNEFFILLKNLLIYEKYINHLHLFLYDPDYFHIYEDPMYDIENYDQIFQNLKNFKYLHTLEIEVGSLYYFFICIKAFEFFLENAYSLKNLSIGFHSNDDEQQWNENDYIYNNFIDILIKRKQLISISFKINKPSKKDILLLSLMQESLVEEFKIEKKSDWNC